jgi:hypothetical protein
MICWAETIAWPLIQPLVDYGYVFTCCFLFIKDQAMHPLGLLLLRLLWKCQSFCAHILKFIVQGIGVGYFLACKLHIFVCVHTAYVCDFAHMHAIFILVLLVGHRCFYIINVVYMPPPIWLCISGMYRTSIAPSNREVASDLESYDHIQFLWNCFLSESMHSFSIASDPLCCPYGFK